jgi:spore germination protein PD
MNFQVTNKALCVGDIRIIGVSSSSVFLIGDTEQIICSSIFDTPPESVIVGAATLPPEEEGEAEAEAEEESPA